MMNKIKDAEHLQTIAEMRQKIAELEIEVRMQAYVCRLMYAGLCMQVYVCRHMYNCLRGRMHQIKKQSCLLNYTL